MSKGHSEDGGDVTEEMVEFPGCLERQAKYQGGNHLGNQQATQSRSNHQLSTHSPSHDAVVIQGVADGHTAVIAHGCQEEGVGAPQEKEEVHLYSTAQEGNGFSLCCQVYQHLGDNDKGVASLGK